MITVNLEATNGFFISRFHMSRFSLIFIFLLSGVENSYAWTRSCAKMLVSVNAFEIYYNSRIN